MLIEARGFPAEPLTRQLCPSILLLIRLGGHWRSCYWGVPGGGASSLPSQVLLPSHTCPLHCHPPYPSFSFPAGGGDAPPAPLYQHLGQGNSHVIPIPAKGGPLLSTLFSFSNHWTHQLMENWQDWFVQRGLVRMIRT